MYIRPSYTIVRERLLEPKNKMQVIAGPRQVGKTFSVRRLAERKGWRLLGHVCSNIYANVHSKATNGYPYYL